MWKSDQLVSEELWCERIIKNFYRVIKLDVFLCSFRRSVGLARAESRKINFCKIIASSYFLTPIKEISSSASLENGMDCTYTWAAQFIHGYFT